MKSACKNSNPASPALPAQLQSLLQRIDDPAFEAALGAEAVSRAQRFIAGINAYRRHPAHRDVPEAPVIWREGTTRLLDYHPHAASDAPLILVIPSLINRFTILDLDVAPSFLRHLASSGFRPLVVDWDAPGSEEQTFALDDYLLRLGKVLAWVRQRMRADKLHLIGYCMGGLLALAMAQLHRQHIQTLTLLATPWDFHQPKPATARMLAGLADDIDDSAAMPVDIIQYLFALLQPLQPVNKFIRFAALPPDSKEARHFVLLEDWLNDGVPLPIKVARSCLQDWYGANQTAQLGWSVCGQIIDPRQLAMPSYVVVPGRDHIVPPESALPLAKLLPHSTLHEPMTGHIGMMASRNAPHLVWKPMLRWLEEHR